MIGFKVYPISATGQEALDEAIREDAEAENLDPRKILASKKILFRGIVSSNPMSYQISFTGKTRAMIRILEKFRSIIPAKQFLEDIAKQLGQLREDMIETMRLNGARLSEDYNIEEVN